MGQWPAGKTVLLKLSRPTFAALLYASYVSRTSDTMAPRCSATPANLLTFLSKPFFVYSVTCLSAIAAALPLSTNAKARSGIGALKPTPASVAFNSAFTTACLVLSSSVKRRPYRSRRRPPTPRSNSAAKVFVCSSGLPGSTKPVGCNCTRSMSTSRAPASRARRTPSPVVCGPSVVGKPSRSGRCFNNKLSASSMSRPKPPEAITAEVASSTNSVPLEATRKRQPAPPRSRPAARASTRSLSCCGLSDAHAVSNFPAADVTA
mmetsp:Transcript_107172/g.300029  ORF Transcript_107172/g.300029 Transcript_107172/m.300029 type:complete len:263 (+) Transcript_107172:400-1188(+)